MIREIVIIAEAFLRPYINVSATLHYIASQVEMLDINLQRLYKATVITAVTESSRVGLQVCIKAYTGEEDINLLT